MPGMNGTGPLGQGPGADRGRGPCMGGGQGRGRGFGRGMGFGGRGFGRGMIYQDSDAQNPGLVGELRDWLGRLEQRLDSLTEKLRNG